MGYEYRVETYTIHGNQLTKLFREHALFTFEDAGSFHFGRSSDCPLFTARLETDYVYLLQHVATSETDALLGLFIRSILSQNDHVVISEL